MKNIIFLVSFLFLFFIGIGFAKATSQPIEFDFFYSPTCPHCAAEEVFLKSFEIKYPEVKINKFSVQESDNIVALENKYSEYEVVAEYKGMVPANFIHSATGKKYFIGFDDNAGKNMEEYVASLLAGNADATANTNPVPATSDNPVVGQNGFSGWGIAAIEYVLIILIIISGALIIKKYYFRKK
jgi:glutaredoxin-related protein